MMDLPEQQNIMMISVANRIRGLISSKKRKQDTMLSRFFRAHGQVCASRPWEVIIGTLTTIVCIMSMSFFSTNHKICGWNYMCQEPEDDTKSSDVIILTLTRCLAVVYVYLQFRNLRKLGSKYLLGIAGIFTIFSSFVFSIGVIHMIGTDLTGLNEALPFFLLLVDLSKACTLAKFAFSAITQDEVVENIGHGMAKLGPVLTLDAMVETLVIGVGTLSGVRTLETMCCFGCLSVIANYLAFMTFYPACLALILDLTRGSRPLLQIQKLAKAWQEEEADEEKPNPVTQRVKVIMSAGLVFVHVHGRLFVSGGDDLATAMNVNTGMPIELSSSKVLVPDIPLWQFYAKHLASLSVDYIITLILAAILTFKYVILDRDDLSANSDTSDSSSSTTGTESATPSTPAGGQEHGCQTVDSDASDVCDSEVNDVSNPLLDKDVDAASSEEKINGLLTTVVPDRPSCLFTIGEDSEEEVDVMRTVDAQTQTESSDSASGTAPPPGGEVTVTAQRTSQECAALLKTERGATQLTDAEILDLVDKKCIPSYKLESVLRDHVRGVAVRRSLVSKTLEKKSAMDGLPYMNYDYKYVDGACCENVIGYVPVPVGVAGPLRIDGKDYIIPMATTEGCLVASTNRGCRALMESKDGVASRVIGDGMTRAPLVRFASACRAADVKKWFEDRDNYDLVAEEFNSTSRFARLRKLEVAQWSHELHIRFVAVTGDAMGMNMLSKGCEKSLNMLQEKFFPDMEIVSLSGNYCTDKKPNAINWIKGRGKSVVAEATVPRDTIKNILKTSAAALVDLNISKNLIGSIAAGSIGGFNAHAANMVTAIYIATGQDPAQNICSSNCLTHMERTGDDNEDLYISCTMPSIEVGTVGGGTILPPQSACLEMLGVRGANKESPGENASLLARIVCATVMAGELSLMSALAAGHLVKSHLKHNRSTINMATNGTAANSPQGVSALGPFSSTACSQEKPVPEPGTCYKASS